MPPRYPMTEPYDHGLLDAGDGHHVYWEACGNPAGKPAVVVHGGPGSGCRPGHRRLCDPARYKLVLFDQRGCGRSRPHASDPAAGMRSNTTAHLIADLEQLREQLGIGRWLMLGWSWGSTLILAYAEQYPQRVSEIVVHGVTTTRRAEIDWLYGGMRHFVPEAWDRFQAGVPATDRADVLAGYARLMEDPDPLVREQAAHRWCDWEDAILSLETGSGPATAYRGRASDHQLAFVRIAAHYFSHRAWLAEDELIRNAGRLAGVPGVLLHGRRDMGGTETPWLLARAWPGAELTVFEDAGHLGSDALHEAFRDALDRFAGA